MPTNILIVDDNTEWLNTMRMLFDGPEFSLAFAEDGAQALARVALQVPDVILLDVMLPEIDGFDVCRQLRQVSTLTSVPILLVTALGDRQSRLQGIRAGADDFITKPVDTIELRERVLTYARLNRYRQIIAERHKLDWVLENTVDGFLALDERQRIVYANLPGRMYLNLPDDLQMLGDQTFLDRARSIFTLEPEHVWAAVPLTHDEQPRYLITPRQRNTEPMWLEVDVLHIGDDPRTRYMLRLHDVTERMTDRRDRWAFQRAVAHKLRTPLTSMITSMQLLVNHADDLEGEEVRRLASGSLEGMQRLKAVIDDVLSFTNSARIPSGDRQFDLAEVETLLDEPRRELNLPSLKVSLQTERDRLVVPLSRHHMQLIFWELLDNAHKFHPQNAPNVVVHVAQMREDEVRISVLNDGTSLAPEVTEQIWTPYFQGERSFTGEVEGMGLGLSMVAVLVWSVSGTYRAFNSQGKSGVVVEINLPLLPDDH